MINLSQRIITPLCSIIALVAAMYTHTAASDPLTIEVENVDTQRGGSVLVLLFGSGGFPKDHRQALSTQSLPAAAETLTFTFESPDHPFAIKVLHDEDGSGTVTKNWTGIIPSEGLGFSNGARLSLLGPPSFRKAVLKPHDSSEPIAISIRYPHQRSRS